MGYVDNGKPFSSFEDDLNDASLLVIKKGSGNKHNKLNFKAGKSTSNQKRKKEKANEEALAKMEFFADEDLL